MKAHRADCWDAVTGKGGGSLCEGTLASGDAWFWTVLLIPKRQLYILIGDFRPENDVYLGGNLVTMKVE